MCWLRSFLLTLGLLASSGTRFRIDIGAEFVAKLYSHPQEDQEHDRNVSLVKNQPSKAENNEAKPADIHSNLESTSMEKSSPLPQDYLEGQGSTQNASDDQSARAGELGNSYEEDAPEFLRAMAEYMGQDMKNDVGSEQINLTQVAELSKMFGDKFDALADKLSNDGSIADVEESSQDVANEDDHVIRLAARAAEFGELFEQVHELARTGNGTEPVALTGELADLSEKLRILAEKGDFDFMKEMVEKHEQGPAENSPKDSPVDYAKDIDDLFENIIDNLGEDGATHQAEKLQA